MRPSMDTSNPASHGRVQSGHLEARPYSVTQGQRRVFTGE